MRVLSLMYHDVVEPSHHEASGFSSADAALYKLAPQLFDRHLKVIAETVKVKPITVDELSGPPIRTSPPTNSQTQTQTTPWMITFDDGGASSRSEIVDRLEELGWRGHFFITAGVIGTAAFLSAPQIRELHRRGHVIGAHSYSHPLRMASCSPAEIRREWRQSVDVISDILGESVVAASIPGGQYSRLVALAAAECGITSLFTSEPTSRLRAVDGCRVYGRYSIQRWTSAEEAAAMAAGELGPRLKQLALWNAKKLVKAAGGKYYLRLRESLAGRT